LGCICRRLHRFFNYGLLQLGGEMSPEANHWQSFVESIEAERDRRIKVAQCPTTRPHDSHDILCEIPAYNFCLAMAKDRLEAVRGLP